tara:strand:+ start:868 stop:2640 length:1773 start_codon:yes stop_codon:yes gene_type:complete
MADGYTEDPLVSEDPLQSEMSQEEIALLAAQDLDQLAAEDLARKEQKLMYELYGFPESAPEAAPPPAAPEYTRPFPAVGEFGPLQDQADFQKRLEGLGQTLRQPEVLGVAPPPRVAAETDEGLPAYAPDVSGYNEAAAAHRARGRYERKMGDIRAQMEEKRFGPEQLTRAERNAQVREEAQADRVQYSLEFEDDMEDAMLEQAHPGASLKQIKDWKYLLKLNEDIVSGARDISTEGAADVLRRAAVAKRNLAKSQEIDPGRAFGNAGSKILAALAIGAGSWAATRTGRNPALELYNKAIANDIAAQKEMFQHKRQAPGRMRSEYKFFMDKYNSAEVAELATAATKWKVAAQELTALGLRTKGVINQQKANALAGEARAKGQAISGKAAHAAQRALAMQYSGIKDLSGMKIRWTGGKHGLDKQDPNEKKILLSELEKANKLSVALDMYVASQNVKGSWVPFSKERTQAEGIREALIQSAGEFFDMGVLQEFEREFLNSVIPGANILKENVLTALDSWGSGDDLGESTIPMAGRPAAYAKALKEFIDKRFYGAVKYLGNYEPWEEKKKYTVRKKGERGSSAADMALAKSRGK